MRRLSTRLLVSHALVALVGGVVAYAVVRVLAPQMYDQSVQMMMGGAMSSGMRLRGAAVSATSNALLIGVLAGAVTAVLAGAWSARRILAPLDEIRVATRRLAAGHYDEPISTPPDTELAAVVADVNTLARRLAETEARRSELLGEVAHEMRTPLTVLEGYLEGLIDGVFQADEETLSDLAPELARLRRLSEDLSALSRAQERGFDLRLQPVDLHGLLARTAERLRPQFRDAGVSLHVAAGPAQSHATADPDRIGQVLTNLLGNALAATPPGGTVAVALRSGGPTVQISVSDTGVGIDSADLSRIFERFYRVRVPASEVVRKGGRHGSGIGLTIAQGIARAHGGDLIAASPGRGLGSTFVLELPARVPD